MQTPTNRPATSPVQAVHEALTELQGFNLRFADSHEKQHQVQTLIDSALAELVQLEQRADVAEAAYTLLQTEWQAFAEKSEPPTRSTMPEGGSGPNVLQDAGGMAESEGFEPPNGFPSPDFEKSGLAATPPEGSTDGDRNTPPRHAFYEDVFDELEHVDTSAAEIERKCRGCGCSALNPCLVRNAEGVRGCAWTRVDPTICDACVFPSSRVRGPELLAGAVEVSR